MSKPSSLLFPGNRGRIKLELLLESRVKKFKLWSEAGQKGKLTRCNYC